MRRVLLLAAGVALAGIGVMVGSGGHGTAAEISGDPLDRAKEQAAYASLADTTPVPPPAPPAPPPTLDLSKIELVGDHYEAPRSDGTRATLTLDPALQVAAEKLLVEAKVPRGAIVAMAPDGRILALAGRRTDDTSGKGDGTIDPTLATDAWAPAASVFKLVTASALVGKGVDPDDKIAFHGGVRSVLESNLHDDKRDNNSASLLFGVAHSNNAILGKLAYLHLQPAELVAQAKALGIDKDLGVRSRRWPRAADDARPHVRAGRRGLHVEDRRRRREHDAVGQPAVRGRRRDARRDVRRRRRATATVHRGERDDAGARPSRRGREQGRAHDGRDVRAREREQVVRQEARNPGRR